MSLIKNSKSTPYSIKNDISNQKGVSFQINRKYTDLNKENNSYRDTFKKFLDIENKDKKFNNLTNINNLYGGTATSLSYSNRATGLSTFTSSRVNGTNYGVVSIPEIIKEKDNTTKRKEKISNSLTLNNLLLNEDLKSDLISINLIY